MNRNLAILPVGSKFLVAVETSLHITFTWSAPLLQTRP